MDIATILDQENHHNRPRREYICFHLALMTHHDHTKFYLPVSCSIREAMVQDLLIDSKSQERISYLDVFFSQRYGFECICNFWCIFNIRRFFNNFIDRQINEHYFRDQSFTNVWELFGRRYSEATWFYFSKDFIFDCTTYSIHRSFASNVPR